MSSIANTQSSDAGNSHVIRRLETEYISLLADPPPGFDVHPKAGNLFEWRGTVKDLINTPYEGGTFKFSIDFPDDYPITPPLLVFHTKIYHPNIDTKTGFVALADLYEFNWSPIVTVSKFLLSLEVLLRTPDLEHPLVPEIAVEMDSKPEIFAQTAREWTKDHAK